jgi:hypothetical protein
MQKLCSELGFKFSTDWGYLNPCDKMLDFCEGKNIGEQAKEVLDKLSWDLHDVLNICKKEAYKPCLSQRIFPIINWDLSVSLCHTYCGPLIIHNFLEMSYKDILAIRHNQGQCKTCQKHGLHRLDIEMLKKYINIYE